MRTPDGPTSLYGMHAEAFSELAAFEVREVLLVASLYDAFAFEEDGQLNELICREYRNLDLSLRHTPRFTLASTGTEALALASSRAFDLVVTTSHLPDMGAEELAPQMRERCPGLPITALAAHAWELPPLEALLHAGRIEALFLWQGDVRTLLAALLLEEDRRNAAADAAQGVQAILLVEDDTRFLSMFLPHLVTEVTRQTARLVAEGINPSHRMLRLHARPKILLARTFEQAWELWNTYRHNLLGVVSDVAFPMEGNHAEEAGRTFFQRIREVDRDLPLLLCSSEEDNATFAKTLGVPFIHKPAPEALETLRAFLRVSLGFGDFVFRTPEGVALARARTIREFLELLGTVDETSLHYHGQRQHFSRWFAARTEFELAASLRARRDEDFSAPGALRTYLQQTVGSFLSGIQRGTIVDFSVEDFSAATAFARLGTGSMGGKGRGLAFFKRLLAQHAFDVAGVEVGVPQTVVVGSDVFDRFLDDNDLRRLVLRLDTLEDAALLDAFRQGRFPADVRAQLAHLLGQVRHPLAVRSSSLLEDSLYQPFAGVYATLMLPNNHPSLDVRLAQLLEALKVVYASTWMRRARAYVAASPRRLEEERMAVLIQRLVGSPHGTRFYPTLSGVAASYNFYPFGDILPEDGVMHLALGLGKAVVEGLEALRVCPRRPTVLPQFSSTGDILRNAQRRFWALDLAQSDVMPGLNVEANIAEVDVAEGVREGGALPVISTYRSTDDVLKEGWTPGGVPIVTFSRLLKGREWPLPAIVSSLLRRAEEGMARPVELEFAVQVEPGRPPAFSVLQVRPMVLESLGSTVAAEEQLGQVLAESASALGHGRQALLEDLVLVDPALPRSRTVEVAAILESLNQQLSPKGYVLMGPGRWGSRDPWLGIPVVWSQIHAAKAVVETDFLDLAVEPSQGSHFFHNLTAFGVAFLPVHAEGGGGRVDWPWLLAQLPAREYAGGLVRHLHLRQGVEVVVDGSTRRGLLRLSHPTSPEP